MSRTVRGSKPLGYDFWTARPFNKGGGGKGSYAKKRTHKAERRVGSGKFQSREQDYWDDYEGF